MAQAREWLQQEVVRRAGVDEDVARRVEVGVYNWTLAKATEMRIAKRWGNARFASMYAAKARSMLCNLDPRGYVGNAQLALRLKDAEFDPHELAAMRPEHVFPERWRQEIDRKMQRDKYMATAKPSAMTDQFLCGRCRKRECVFQELQMRSCDEPASLFITCLNCGLRWRQG